MDIKTSTKNKTIKRLKNKPEDPNNYDNWNLIHTRVSNSILVKIGSSGSIKFEGEVKIADAGDAKISDLIIAAEESIRENILDGDSFAMSNIKKDTLKDKYLDGREINVETISNRGESTTHVIGHIENEKTTLEITLTTNQTKHIMSDLILASFTIKARSKQ